MSAFGALVRSGRVATTARCRRVVHRLRRGDRTCDARIPRSAQVEVLLTVLDESVASLRSADTAVAACGAPDGAAGQTARECARALSGFHRLRVRLAELPITEPDLVDVRAYAGRLLAYDQWMVQQALNVAYTVHPDSRTEAARLQLNGLGRPADELRRLRDALKATGRGEKRQP
ncbi:hypothetical protein AB0K93_26720 [Streptomyces sp. NPDC052676]|uniref:hypothetical protein n=1 Tax=Streptomyces sp. NPDC052676 TaxID=3154953 RepID=UPI00342DAE79